MAVFRGSDKHTLQNHDSTSGLYSVGQLLDFIHGHCKNLAAFFFSKQCEAKNNVHQYNVQSIVLCLMMVYYTSFKVNELKTALMCQKSKLDWHVEFDTFFTVLSLLYILATSNESYKSVLICLGMISATRW